MDVFWNDPIIPEIPKLQHGNVSSGDIACFENETINIHTFVTGLLSHPMCGK